MSLDHCWKVAGQDEQTGVTWKDLVTSNLGPSSKRSTAERAGEYTRRECMVKTAYNNTTFSLKRLHMQTISPRLRICFISLDESWEQLLSELVKASLMLFSDSPDWHVKFYIRCPGSTSLFGIPENTNIDSNCATLDPETTPSTYLEAPLHTAFPVGAAAEWDYLPERVVTWWAFHTFFYHHLDYFLEYHKRRIVSPYQKKNWFSILSTSDNQTVLILALSVIL